MAEKSTDLPVRIIGSRELHQNLPTILRELERNDVRYVLTVHGKPRAVLVGRRALHEHGPRSQEPERGPGRAPAQRPARARRLNPASLDDLEKALEPKSE